MNRNHDSEMFVALKDALVDEFDQYIASGGELAGIFLINCYFVEHIIHDMPPDMQKRMRDLIHRRICLGMKD